MKHKLSYMKTGGWILSLVVVLVSIFAVQAQMTNTSYVLAQKSEATEEPQLITPSEMYEVPVDGPNMTGEVPPLDKSRAIVLNTVSSANSDIATGSPSETSEKIPIIQPTEMYRVPVDGPNMTGKVPPLDKSKAIALHETNRVIPNAVVGQWYDHYAYYTVSGTQVEQYTNYQEKSTGQYIWMQWWKNNNGGTNRYLTCIP